MEVDFVSSNMAPEWWATAFNAIRSAGMPVRTSRRLTLANFTACISRTPLLRLAPRRGGLNSGYENQGEIRTRNALPGHTAFLPFQNGQIMALITRSQCILCRSLIK